MKIILLAAGQSSRLQPISDKILLKFCGKTLLEHQIEILSSAGMDDFIIVGNKDNLPKIQAICQKLYGKFHFAEQKDLSTGMSGCVLAAEPFIKTDESILIVSTNDLVEENAYQLILESIHRHPKASLLLAKKVNQYFPGGYLEINSENKIQSIVEKPEKGKEPSDLINLVIHYHYNAQLFLEELKHIQSENDDLYEVAIDTQIKKGVDYFAVPYHGFWQAVKFPWHVLDLQEYFLENLHSHVDSSVFLAKNVTIKGHVYLGKNVKIYENSVIKGPVYLGDNTVVANNCLIRDSIIGENSVIGFNTEVARSFLHEKVWTHTNYIGDSVIDKNVSFGSGFVTGNLRFDEKNINVNIKNQKTNCGKNKLGSIIGENVRFGVNTSIMPGIKIGKNSLIGAGLIIDQDIPNTSFVKQNNNNFTITKNTFTENLPNRENFKKGI